MRREQKPPTIFSSAIAQMGTAAVVIVRVCTWSFSFATTFRNIGSVTNPNLPEEILEEIRRQYPPILTTAHVAEMMHSTIGDVRDKVHRGDLPAVRWGQQFRFFREEVLAAMTRFQPGDEIPPEEEPDSVEQA